MGSREAMLREVAEGGARARAADGGDASHKLVLGRGCDPVMAAQSLKMLPPLLDGVKMLVATDDDAFLRLLREHRVDVVFFAPGACRWDAARRSIPGGTRETQGWGLDRYRAAVRELQGEACVVVGSAEEREVVPMLRKALGLS
jgi:hypothetical protein